MQAGTGQGSKGRCHLFGVLLMLGDFLVQAAVFLAAAAIAAPLAKWLQVSSVIGYLAAGVLIGPFGIGFVYQIYQVETILHIAEYGVVLLLFLIGLELKPKRLWLMRAAIFGLGGAQVFATGLVLAAVLALVALPTNQALFIGFALALSSTAFVLQVLQEKGELTTPHGRSAFAVLLFQDLAAIPLIAIVPLLVVGGDAGVSWLAIAQAFTAIIVVILGGRFVLPIVYKLVASTGVREAMTASALLTVVGVALLMDSVGLSAALGAFLAGALLSDSAYRHQIDADTAPFEGLLLGLFFTAVGMALNLSLLAAQPWLIGFCVLALISIKSGILFGLARWRGLTLQPARRLALALCQGGEFAFVLLAAALSGGLVSRELSELTSVVVTLSMLATPILLLVDEHLTPKAESATPFDDLPEEDGHVIIGGFGRFGQIVARVLQAKGIKLTAIDVSPDQVALVAKFGNKAYFGDVQRLDILRAAQTDKARAFVLAIDNMEASLKSAELLRAHYPSVPIYARARNRRHVHLLMDIGVKIIHRETFNSALELTRDLLDGLNIARVEADHMLNAFRELDEKRLFDDYEHYTEMEKLRANAQAQSEELEQIFRDDLTTIKTINDRAEKKSD